MSTPIQKPAVSIENIKKDDVDASSNINYSSIVDNVVWNMNSKRYEDSGLNKTIEVPENLSPRSKRKFK